MGGTTGRVYPDPRSINAIAVKRRWIAGEATDEELAAAEADAWVAAWAAAETAARNAQVDMLTQMLREYVGAGEEDTQCACMRV